VTMDAASPLLLPEDHPLHRVQRVAVGVSAIALVVCVLAGFGNLTQFLRSYLVAYVFWVGGALGCLALLMIHHVTGGAWGVAIRRLLESGARTLPMMAILFLPIAFGVRRLYEWAQPERVAQDPLLQHQALYLNVPFFLARTAFYFIAWSLVVRALTRWSLRQDASFDPLPGQRLELISRGGLLLMGLTMTFAAIDWTMSLQPHWSSTIYGVIFMGGSALTAFAVVIPVVALLSVNPPVEGHVSNDQLSDLGKLLLAFVMLWAYFNVSQFIIIYQGNLPEEIPWYIDRITGPWAPVGVLVLVGHFVLPFSLLLSRNWKRKGTTLARIAMFMLVMRAVDLIWTIGPIFRRTGSTLSWLDFAAVLGLGALWLLVFFRNLGARALVPAHDPYFEDALANVGH